MCFICIVTFFSSFFLFFSFSYFFFFLIFFLLQTYKLRDLHCSLLKGAGFFSRFPCCVLLALSWNTNKNINTDKLSRAINYCFLWWEKLYSVWSMTKQVVCALHLCLCHIYNVAQFTLQCDILSERPACDLWWLGWDASPTILADVRCSQ